MQVVKPADDPHHRKRIIKRINEAKGIPSFYYALSHLWGLKENNRYLSNEIGDYVDDENGKPAEPVSMRPEKHDTLVVLLRDHPDSYWWIDVLCARTDTPLDIMGDIYACCIECIAMVDCEPSLISSLHTMKIVKEDFTSLMESGFKYLSSFGQIYEQCPRLPVDLLTFMQSKWWTRVWTWQEMALPFGEVRFMAETDTGRCQRNTITMDDLIDSCTNAWGIMDYCQYTICSTLFHVSARRCYDPVDYVYGVLGLLQIKIPRVTDPTAVWLRFLYELDNYIEDFKGKEFQIGNFKRVFKGIDDRAYQVRLGRVTKMCDVYLPPISYDYIIDGEIHDDE
ncbi:predicted protein [Lichtheimia corymbifera JMRC:FSU:9682]|uniref:Heterokaryon incompatibility domain-containing protein n=1 Tax=Lichtheimia corymbifera JMRC:FSU:9682 TaxID=1263082 RepID=A0A068SHY2_9FUNG|nr:predicted protein [Lichtheimia corymbifera JMRC:FSU:9682]